jgi:hypothetical protein
MKNGVATITTARLELLPIKSRGVTYGLPAEHLGVPCTSQQPIVLARLGLKFYTEFVAEAERFFYATK